MRFAQMLMNNRRVLVNVSPESRNKPRGWGETSPGGGGGAGAAPSGSWTDEVLPCSWAWLRVRGQNHCVVYPRKRVVMQKVFFSFISGVRTTTAGKMTNSGAPRDWPRCPSSDRFSKSPANRACLLVDARCLSRKSPRVWGRPSAGQTRGPERKRGSRALPSTTLSSRSLVPEFLEPTFSGPAGRPPPLPQGATVHTLWPRRPSACSPLLLGLGRGPGSDSLWPLSRHRARGWAAVPGGHPQQTDRVHLWDGPSAWFCAAVSAQSLKPSASMQTSGISSDCCVANPLQP